MRRWPPLREVELQLGEDYEFGGLRRRTDLWLRVKLAVMRWITKH